MNPQSAVRQVSQCPPSLPLQSSAKTSVLALALTPQPISIYVGSQTNYIFAWIHNLNFNLSLACPFDPVLSNLSHPESQSYLPKKSTFNIYVVCDLQIAWFYLDSFHFPSFTPQ